MAEQRDGVIRDDHRNPKFSGGGETAEAVEDAKKVKSSGGGIRIRSICPSPPAHRDANRVRRIRLQILCRSSGYGSWDGLDRREDVETLEFGRDANRLDYFRVIPFDVHEGNGFHGVANYGGGRGSGSSSNNGTSGGDGDMVGTITDRERGSIGISGNIGGNDGEVVGLILDREMGSTGAGGGDRIGEMAAGVYANNGGGGEVVVQRLEQERDNVGGGVSKGQIQLRSFGNNGGSERWIMAEEGGGLVEVVGWWKKWWWFLDLWK